MCSLVYIARVIEFSSFITRACVLWMIHTYASSNVSQQSGAEEGLGGGTLFWWCVLAQFRIKGQSLLKCVLHVHWAYLVFMVLVSICIFMKTHNPFWVPSQRYKCVHWYIYSKSNGVLCFHYSRMRIVNDTYLRLQHCLSTLAPRQKK